MGASKVWVSQGKLNGDRRRVHMPPMLLVVLANIPSNREPKSQVFPYSSQSAAKHPWLAVVKRAGIQ